MKLIGSRRNGKHAGGEHEAAKKSKNRSTRNSSRSSNSPRSSKRKKIIAVSLVTIFTILLLLGSLVAILRWEIQPFYDFFFPLPDEGRLSGFRTPRPHDPDDPDAPEDPPTPDPRTHDEDGQPLPLDKIRNMKVYTFMIFGIDNDGNTDVIMVGSFNAEDYTIDIATIYRDTLMNSPWDANYYEKKANFIQPMMRRTHDPNRTTEGYAKAMDNALDHFEGLFGFNIDFWFTVNMRAFVSLVDSIGGVKFHVPRAMPEWADPDYPDMGAVSLAAGTQTLNGRQALAYLRFRKIVNEDGTETHLGDEFRTTNQQNFLKAVADQILSSNSVNITTLAETFLRHARTDIELDNLIRLGREFLKVDSNNINFTSIPGEFIFRHEFMAVNVDAWLEIVNSRFNPFNFDIEVTDVSIVSLDENRKLYVTDGRWQGNLNPDWRPFASWAP